MLQLIIPHHWHAMKCERVELHSGRMAKRAKKKTFRAVAAVRALARERIGTPPAEQIIPDRKQERMRKEKHKATLGQMLAPEE